MEDTTLSRLPVQVLSMADDLQAADAMRKLQRNAAAANHQRMMGGGGGGGGIDQGPPGGGGWRSGPANIGPGGGHGAGTAGMQADMQRRMSNLSGEQCLCRSNSAKRGRIIAPPPHSGRTLSGVST